MTRTEVATLRVMATVVIIIAVVLLNIWFWPHVWNHP